ncbi:hypothetical protein Tco_0766536 [Tanacetum coccineum]
MDELFGPLYEEYYERRNPEVSIDSVVHDTLNNEDNPSSSIIVVDDNEDPQIVSTSEEQTSSISNDIDDESIQEDITNLDGNTFITLFCSLILEEVESSSTNHDPLNMHGFYQQHCSIEKWTKDHPLKQVIGNPTKLAVTRSKLNTNAEMCMYALTMSTTKPKKYQRSDEDHSWIELMQDELHQFKRLKVWELVKRPAGRNIIGVKWL